MLEQRRTASPYPSAAMTTHRPEGPSIDLQVAPQGQLEDLIELVGDGDAAAFEILYARVWGRVFGLAWAILRDPHQGEEVLLEVWRTAARFDASEGAAQVWISLLTRRRAVNRVRSSQASRACDAVAAAGVGERDFDVVLDQVESRLDVEGVRNCLKHLTPQQHEPLTLAFYGGHSYASVASLLDLPLGMVKTRIREELIRLRDCSGCSGVGLSPTVAPRFLVGS